MEENDNSEPVVKVIRYVRRRKNKPKLPIDENPNESCKPTDFGDTIQPNQMEDKEIKDKKNENEIEDSNIIGENEINPEEDVNGENTQPKEVAVSDPTGPIEEVKEEVILVIKKGRFWSIFAFTTVQILALVSILFFLVCRVVILMFYSYYFWEVKSHVASGKYSFNGTSLKKSVYANYFVVSGKYTTSYFVIVGDSLGLVVLLIAVIALLVTYTSKIVFLSRSRGKRLTLSNERVISIIVSVGECLTPVCFILGLVSFFPSHWAGAAFTFQYFVLQHIIPDISSGIKSQFSSFEDTQSGVTLQYILFIAGVAPMLLCIVTLFAFPIICHLPCFISAVCNLRTKKKVADLELPTFQPRRAFKVHVGGTNDEEEGEEGDEVLEDISEENEEKGEDIEEEADDYVMEAEVEGTDCDEDGSEYES